MIYLPRSFLSSCWLVQFRTPPVHPLCLYYLHQMCVLVSWQAELIPDMLRLWEENKGLVMCFVMHWLYFTVKWKGEKKKRRSPFQPEETLHVASNWIFFSADNICYAFHHRPVHHLFILAKRRLSENRTPDLGQTRKVYQDGQNTYEQMKRSHVYWKFWVEIYWTAHS